MEQTIFPKFQTRFSSGGQELKVELKSWVRVKKGGVYYLVLSRTDFPISLVGDNSDEPKQFQTLSSGIQYFIENCQRIQALWSKPSKTEIKRMLMSETLKIEAVDLTDKERYLLNLKIM
jgi:hypothetical protein